VTFHKTDDLLAQAELAAKIIAEITRSGSRSNAKLRVA
jgi:hypothetical protein